MTPQEILEAARAGELERLGVERKLIGDAVHRFAQAGDAASALELAGRTWRIWFSRGELDEGAAVVAAALAVPGGEAAALWRARTLYGDGLFAFRSGDQARSKTSNEQALRIARQLGEGRGECDALSGLARVALRDGDYTEVIDLARLARERAMLAKDREAGAAPLHLHAAGTRLRGDHAAARELYVESLTLNTELGNRAWVAMEMHNLGWVELHLGHVEAAKARFHQRDAESDHSDQDEAWKELNWSAIAAAEGDRAEAKRRFVVGSNALARLGRHLDPDDLAELEWLERQLQSWWTRGCVSSPHSSLMSQDIVLATKLGGGAWPHSVATSSTQWSWNAAAQLSWPVSTASPAGGSTSSSRGSGKAATWP